MRRGLRDARVWVCLQEQDGLFLVLLAARPAWRLLGAGSGPAAFLDPLQFLHMELEGVATRHVLKLL